MKMSTPFPFEFVTLGVPVPFKVEANPDFPGETSPICILTNLGPASPDTFITIGTGLPPNGPDPWELTFHWATTGGPAGGAWQLDAFLESLGPPFGNVTVPGFPVIIPGGAPGKFAPTITIPPFTGIFPAPGVFLFRLYATLRWNITGAPPIVKVSGRAQGPLIDFYMPV
jgi:hypothetical protein